MFARVVRAQEKGIELKIERITKTEKNRDIFAVAFDDGEEIKVSAAQIADFSLCAGRELSEGERAELTEAVKLRSAKARAIRILGNRSLSKSEIAKRLVKKGEDGETARETAEWLENIGVINDEEYAAAIVKHYCAGGYGRARIRDELYRRGIPRELWDEALERHGGGEEAAAYEYIKKKLGSDAGKEDIRRAISALQRRGFSYDQARSAISAYMENLENAEEI